MNVFNLEVSISDILNNHINVFSKVTIKGWVRTRRDSKLGISFISLYDGSCLDTIQTIAHSSLLNYKEEVILLTTGCSVIIKGELVYSKSKLQKFEIYIDDLQVIGWIDNPKKYPISSKKHSLEYLRTVAHLRPRTNLIGSITRVRNTLNLSIHKFFHKQGYLWIPTPIITSTDTEGSGEMFLVSTLNKKEKNSIDNFFSKKAFLTVSGQLTGEAYASALSKIYTFGPVFRAENSNTSRHLSEFWMVEPETAYANLEDIINLAEKMLKYLFKIILKERYKEMIFFSKLYEEKVIIRLQEFLLNKINQIEYNDAILILKKSKKKFENKVTWGIDLSSEHERFLTEIYFKTPLVVRNYPKNIKSFYMRLNKDNKTVASMDILFPGIGEIIGGSQREERLNFLEKRIKSLGLSKKKYLWYCDLRRYGTVIHSGFGLGLERLISYITGVKNLRDIIPFPRTPKNINF